MPAIGRQTGPKNEFGLWSEKLPSHGHSDYQFDYHN